MNHSRVASLIEGAEYLPLAFKDAASRFHELQLQTCIKNMALLEKGKLRFHSKKILVIDDESFNCMALVGLLKILKLPNVKQMVDIAYSGEQAIQLLRENIRPSNLPMRYSSLNKSGTIQFLEEQKE